MFRRLTLLLPLLCMLTLSGCLFFPHDRGHGDHDRRGGPGFEQHR